MNTIKNKLYFPGNSWRSGSRQFLTFLLDTNVYDHHQKYMPIFPAFPGVLVRDNSRRSETKRLWSITIKTKLSISRGFLAFWFATIPGEDRSTLVRQDWPRTFSWHLKMRAALLVTVFT